MEYKTQEIINGSKTVDINPTSFSSIFSPLFIDIMIVIAIVGLAKITWGILQRIAFGDVISAKTISASNESFRKAVIGLSVAFLFVSFLAAINPKIRSGEIGFSKIISSFPSIPSGIPRSSSTPPITPGIPGTGKTCADPNVVISSLQEGNVCANTSCKSGCSLDPSILSIVKDEARIAQVNYKIIAALICRESSGNKDAVGEHAQNGKKDCGLMQINKAVCDTSIMDPRTNIQEGIRIFKNKIASVSGSKYSYSGGITKEMMAFASYNCCANGDDPNSQSVSCTRETGFSSPIPKWVCPIDPGSEAFNMCNVKAYACDVYKCMDQF